MLKGPLGSDEEVNDRMAIAKQCASQIELRLIQPTKLLGAVQESGLYDSGVIIQVLREQSNGRAVFVAGAGTEYVNGWYKPSEMAAQGLCKVYEKEGTVDGAAARIFLSQKIVQGGPGSWFISVPPAGAGILSPSDRKLYWSNNKTKLTPFNVWVKDDGMVGEEPCPRAVLTPGMKDDC